MPTLTDRALVLTAVQDGSGSWNRDADGAISTASFWNGGLPGGAGDAATFGPAISAPRTATVDQPTTLGSIILDSSAAGYTIAGPAPIALQTLGGNAQIQVLAGSHTISAPIELANNVQVAVAAASLEVAGPIGGSGGLTKSGAGSLVLSGANTFTGGTTVADGTLYIADRNALADGASLTVSAGGTLIFGAPPAATSARIPANAPTTAADHALQSGVELMSKIDLKGLPGQ